MVPSLVAVDDDGMPQGRGLLYGDERGESGDAPTGRPTRPRADSSGLCAGWRRTRREPSRFWPAQAVANHALSGEAVLDTTTATLALPLFDWTGWDDSVAATLGVTVAQLPRLVPDGRGSRTARRRRAGRSRRAASTRSPSSWWPAPIDAGDVLVLAGHHAARVGGQRVRRSRCRATPPFPTPRQDCT